MWRERQRRCSRVVAMLLAVVGVSRSAVAVAPSESEMSRAKAWFSTVFLGEPSADSSKSLGLELVRQDHRDLPKGPLVARHDAASALRREVLRARTGHPFDERNRRSPRQAGRSVRGRGRHRQQLRHGREKRQRRLRRRGGGQGGVP